MVQVFLAKVVRGRTLAKQHFKNRILVNATPWQGVMSVQFNQF